MYECQICEDVFKTLKEAREHQKKTEHDGFRKRPPSKQKVKIAGYTFYAIEESRYHWYKLCRSRMEMGEVLLYENKKEAKAWMDTLDKARGQQSENVGKGFEKSRFKIIKFKNVK
jgi:hypothetical protein